MRAVNLLPRQQVQQKRQAPNTVALVAAIGGAAVLLVLVGGFLLAQRSVDRQSAALAAAKATLAATPANKVSAQTQAYRQTVLTQREQRSLALAAALGKRVAWDRVLRHVTLVMPNDIWLTSLTGKVPLQSEVAAIPTGTGTATTPSALPPTPTAVTLAGYTYSQGGVARLLERLSVLPDLKNVQLQSSTKTQVGNHTVVNFTIVSDVRKGRGAS
jgi:Tfp pilus assembly protein PilN